MKLTILPMGNIDSGVVEGLLKEFSSLAVVEVNPSMPLPPDGRDRQNGRYLASTLLERLRQEDGERILGVTDADIYTPNSEWIFGYAEIPGKAALVSTHRLQSEERPTYLDRILKEAYHELGHTMGLDHCPRPRCVMHFSKSLVDTDYKGKAYCVDCRAKVKL